MSLLSLLSKFSGESSASFFFVFVGHGRVFTINARAEKMVWGNQGNKGDLHNGEASSAPRLCGFLDTSAGKLVPRCTDLHLWQEAAVRSHMAHRVEEKMRLKTLPNWRDPWQRDDVLGL